MTETAPGPAATATITVQPGAAVAGETAVPGDKSVSHRALLLAALADGDSRISGFLEGADCLATLAAVRALGVEAEGPRDGRITVCGAGPEGLRAPPGQLDLGNSGTAMRLIAGVLAGQPFETTLVGDASLSSRPMTRVIEPLSRMGARIASRDGRAPLTIRGRRPLAPIDYRLPVASAQVKSAVLLAALAAGGRSSVTEIGTTRDHTERMLEAMGVALERRGATISLDGPQRLRALDIRVPGDLSSAAFFLLAGTVAGGPGGLRLRGVGVNPTRRGVIDVLRAMGARIAEEPLQPAGAEPVADLVVEPAALTGIEVDEALVPLAIDEFPVLFVAAALADGVTRFRGLGELRHKESDRIAAMVAGLKAIGVDAEETPDGAVIHGGRPAGGTVESRGDHRVAMAFAMAGLRAAAPVTVLDTANVATSFPGFVDCCRRLGIAIDEQAAERPA